MTNERKKPKPAARGIQAKGRHDKYWKAQQHDAAVWRRLNPLKQPPKLKHRSYFEAVDNADKKKKLEIKITTSQEPTAGYQYVPMGQPELSVLCKELSREQDAMVFIVSDSPDTRSLDHHMHRLGYHFRVAIVAQAKRILQDDGHAVESIPNTSPNPEQMPQREINKQADAVLRDMFPRIPNTDRHQIVAHAFDKDSSFNGELKVGMAVNLTLGRRVQLAALAHIRHTHTRYDQLLRETTWPNARKAVEQPCLDIIAKWRGDEETGRDQLDEILREVIEISDSEEDSDDAPAAPAVAQEPAVIEQKRVTKKQAKRARQRLRRYAAAAEQLAASQSLEGPVHGAMGGTTSPNSTYPPHAVPAQTQRQDSAAVQYGSSRNLPPNRGQSPVLVRAGDGNVPKVGQPSNHYWVEQRPLPAARPGLPDMLLPSIEPTSPNGPFPQAPRQFTEAPRVAPRTIVPEPAQPFPRARSPGFVVISEGNGPRRHPHAEEFDMARAYPESSQRRPVEVEGLGARQPAFYVRDDSHRDRADRARSDVSMLDAPRQGHRVVELRGPRFVAGDSHSPEGHHFSGAPSRIVYLDEHSPRIWEHGGVPHDGLRYQDAAPQYVRSHEQRYRAEEVRHRVEEPRYYVEEPRYRVEEPRFRVEEPRYRVEEPRYRVEEPRYRVEEPRFRVEEPRYQVEHTSQQLDTSGHALRGPHVVHYGEEYSAGTGRHHGQEPAVGQTYGHRYSSIPQQQQVLPSHMEIDRPSLPPQQTLRPSYNPEAEHHGPPPYRRPVIPLA